ncbi:MAG: ATP-binding protein [Chloroflexota bacterium]
MSEQQRQLEHSETYLAAAMEHLRLRLQRLAERHAQPTTALVPLSEAQAAPPQRGGRLFGRREPQPMAALPAPAEAPRVTDEQIRQAAEAVAAAEQLDPPPAAVVLSQSFGLRPFEREILLLCAGMELDTRIAGLCARAQDDPGRPYPTFALAMALSDAPEWGALAPDRPLRYWQLIHIHQPAAVPLTSAALSADERIVNALKGLNYLDDRLAPLVQLLDPPGDTVPPSQRAAAETIVGYLGVGVVTRAPVVQLVGPDSGAKQLVARVAAEQLGLQLVRMAADALPAQTGELEQLARLWEREAILLPLALYLDAAESERPGEGGGARPVQRFIERCGGVVLLDTRETWPGLSDDSLVLDIAPPTPAEQIAAWQEALGAEAGDLPDRLAGQFSMGVEEIRRTALIARSAPEGGAGLGERLWEACRMRSRPQLNTLAQRIDPHASWDDLVLPASEMRLLRQIADQVGQRSTVYDRWGYRDKISRGLGISALFAGPSGTGKTFAAEVLASELRLSLYRIDLSAVVSKYIGETEKNLRRIFDAAERGGVILFFDEADALFGKRSEVKDSHDRYANIEVNYLLQRMEAFGGLAILATNMKDALDAAFLRRLRFIVNFPFPGASERLEMWRRAFPPETPTEALDLRRLAKLNLSGGNIITVAVNAAFLAAAAGEPVRMEHVLNAARTEMRKLEMPVDYV